MEEFKNITELTCNLHLIGNKDVTIDTLKRIVDWMTTPGTHEEDDYIKRQLSYASKFIESK